MDPPSLHVWWESITFIKLFSGYLKNNEETLLSIGVTKLMDRMGLGNKFLLAEERVRLKQLEMKLLCYKDIPGKIS